MFSDLLDALYSQLLDSNPFLDPAYFLAVSMSPDNKITEELNDISGRTIKTLSASDTNGIPGSNIIANYSYDMLGNVLVEIPPAAADSQQNTIYRYNTLGQLIYKRTPDCGDFEYIIVLTVNSILNFHIMILHPNGIEKPDMNMMIWEELHEFLLKHLTVL